MTVGRKGTGYLNVTDGGEVETLSLDVGREGTAYGKVTIDGYGSKILVSASPPDGVYGDTTPNGGNPFPYSGFAGLARAGRESGSEGVFDIRNGGLLEIRNVNGYTDNPFFSLGRQDGSLGKAYIHGSGTDGSTPVSSELRIVQEGDNGDSYSPGSFLSVGQRGEGQLNIYDSGKVTVTGDRARVSVGGGGYEDFVDDPRSQLNLSTGGTLSIDSAGGHGAQLIVGAYSNYIPPPGGVGSGVLYRGAGVVNVDGPDARIDIDSNITDAGVDVEQGARVEVGRYGDGQMNITNGGMVDVTTNGLGQANFVIGNGNGSIGAVTIEGYGIFGEVAPADPSTLKVSTTNNVAGNFPGIIVGNAVYGDAATLLVRYGGQALVEGQNALLNISALGNDPGSSQAPLSTVTVREGGYIHIDGGAATGGYIEVGSEYANSNGALFIEGTGVESYYSQTTVKTSGINNGVNVGEKGTGLLDMDGGILETNHLRVGYGAGGNGTVILEGGAQLNLTGADTSVDVGNQGTGTLNLALSTSSAGAWTQIYCKWVTPPVATERSRLTMTPK